MFNGFITEWPLLKQIRTGAWKGTGEEATFSHDQLDRLLALAQQGLTELAALQAAFLAQQLLKP